MKSHDLATLSMDSGREFRETNKYCGRIYKMQIFSVNLNINTREGSDAHKIQNKDLQTKQKTSININFNESVSRLQVGHVSASFL